MSLLHIRRRPLILTFYLVPLPAFGEEALPQAADKENHLLYIPRRGEEENIHGDGETWVCVPDGGDPFYQADLILGEVHLLKRVPLSLQAS
jgi:hypothetical protein